MSAVQLADLTVTPQNPLDLAEQLITERDWLCDRPVEEELVAEVEGAWCNFRIWFAWQPDLNALIFSCTYDMKIHERSRSKMHALLAAVNERMWLGHFDIGSEDGVIMFRHALLLRGSQRVTSEQFEDLIDIAISECTRFTRHFNRFSGAAWRSTKPSKSPCSIRWARPRPPQSSRNCHNFCQLKLLHTAVLTFGWSSR